MNYIIACRLLAASVLLFVVLSGKAQPPNKRNVGTLKNPVFNSNFPDPTVIGANGNYYAYAT